MFVLDEKGIKELEERLGYCFGDKNLLRQALTHSSFTNEQKIRKLNNYERLEFLGDAVLELSSSEFLFHAYRNMPEGELTRLRASLVCEPALADCSRTLGLGAYLMLGKGEEATGGRERNSIIADVVESVIGAIYLDGGMEAAKAFVVRFVLRDVEERQLFYDSKTVLQEVAQGSLKKEVAYIQVEELGPEHDKTFVVEVRLGEENLGRGQGRTKKAAEQQAAYQALLTLRKRGTGKHVFKKH